ncbi:cobalamin biosynthesis CbiX protein [Salpingoeca rosetta]|uniref:Cobalamin biosynthesis CbiX protein n=1 Tax=Salpingoeca rosetta (strain ATCC 50818 / BSB-021) TaxID=946362 RepID=F2U7R7_SALR5|nr:cobalamin biosynthesis CbiX protein [Salpingoeca rosetta]EGD72822.1 cobalamin biosynthesis CbiX protein [Salpingoeca rosetta]|eukprot:XP_004994645.1 cobalamin biosynthesis CbiX protein [Salpingoeca rosetta]
MVVLAVLGLVRVVLAAAAALTGHAHEHEGSSNSNSTSSNSNSNSSSNSTSSNNSNSSNNTSSNNSSNNSNNSNSNSRNSRSSGSELARAATEQARSPTATADATCTTGEPQTLEEGGGDPGASLLPTVRVSSADRPICLLMDIGSLRAGSVLSMRRIADALTLKLVSGHPPQHRDSLQHTGASLVVPTSIGFSNRIGVRELNGQPAETTVQALERFVRAGHRHFVVLPLFLGPSTAITKCTRALRAAAGKLTSDHVSIKVAPHLVSPSDPRIAQAIATNVHVVLDDAGVWTPATGSTDSKASVAEAGAPGSVTRSTTNRIHVVVVDHGTPTRAVNDVRNLLAAQVRRELGSNVVIVQAASMERRRGQEYDFNDPLLEDVLDTLPWQPGDVVVVALAFISPGRHAGPQGDITRTVEGLRAAYPALTLLVTDVLGQRQQLSNTLIDRFHAAAAV